MMGSQTDPLSRLGSDVFHMVLSYMTLRQLVKVEHVSTQWRDFSKCQTAIWRRACGQRNVDLSEYEHWKEVTGEGRERTANPWRDAAFSYFDTGTFWRKGQCYPSTYSSGNMAVLAMYNGPEPHLLTLKVYTEFEGADDEVGGAGLRIVDKYTGRLEYSVDRLPRGVHVVAGGGYIATSNNGWVGQSVEPVGKVTIYRTPAVRARLGEPPLEIEPNVGGSVPLEEWTSIDWLADCERLAIHVDTVGTKQSPVLIGAMHSRILLCHLDEDTRETRIDISDFFIFSIGNLMQVRADDTYIYLLSTSSLYIICRITSAPLLRILRNDDEHGDHMAAVAYKFPTQSAVELWTQLPIREYANLDGTAHLTKFRFRRVMEYGKSESIWAEETDEEDEAVPSTEAVEEQTQITQPGHVDQGVQTDPIGLGMGASDSHAANDMHDTSEAYPVYQSERVTTFEGDEGYESTTSDGWGGYEPSTSDLGDESHHRDSRWEDSPKLEFVPVDRDSSSSPTAHDDEVDIDDDDEDGGVPVDTFSDLSEIDREPAPFNWFDFEELSGAIVHPWHSMCFTNNDIVLSGPESALLVLHDYRKVLAEAVKIHSMSARSRYVASHCLMIGFPWGDKHAMDEDNVYTVTASGDFIISHYSNMGGLAVIDSKRFPTIPLPNTQFPIPDLYASIVTIPWSFMRDAPENPLLLADSRCLYFSDFSQMTPERNDRQDVLQEQWIEMMMPHPTGVRVWQFREHAPAPTEHVQPNGWAALDLTTL